METTPKLRPALKFGPGYFIKEQMEYRNWTQEELAEIMGYTPKHISKIINDNQPITLETAKILAEVFDNSPQYWLNLDANYRLWLDDKPSEKEKQAELKANIYERMPVRDMIHKNWISSFNSVEELYQNVLQFLGISKLDFAHWDAQVAPLLAKKSENFNQYKASYAYTWYLKALQEARKIKKQPYQQALLKDLYDHLHQYTLMENGVNLFLEALQEAGVVFFVLPHLQKTYLDGAAFYCDENPVIVYTARFKRIDNFWFTVAHEIAHVLLHLSEENHFILDNLNEKSIAEIEVEANQTAGVKLKHPEIALFLKDKIKYLSVNDIENCAAQVQIHPAIIIGKLAYDKTISYANQKLFYENVLDLIDPKYL